MLKINILKQRDVAVDSVLLFIYLFEDKATENTALLEHIHASNCKN